MKNLHTISVQPANFRRAREKLLADTQWEALPAWLYEPACRFQSFPLASLRVPAHRELAIAALMRVFAFAGCHECAS